MVCLPDNSELRNRAATGLQHATAQLSTHQRHAESSIRPKCMLKVEYESFRLVHLVSRPTDTACTRSWPETPMCAYWLLKPSCFELLLQHGKGTGTQRDQIFLQQLTSCQTAADQLLRAVTATEQLLYSPSSSSEPWWFPVGSFTLQLGVASPLGLHHQPGTSYKMPGRSNI